MSVLIVKEPSMFRRRYAYRIKSTEWINIKSPRNEENQSTKLVNIHNVVYIVDDNDVTLFDKRMESGGIFHTECQSGKSSFPINFIWIHLRETS